MIKNSTLEFVLQMHVAILCWFGGDLHDLSWLPRGIRDHLKIENDKLLTWKYYIWSYIV
jgi:hypothetical protein